MRKTVKARQWWYMPLIPVLRRQRQEDLSDLGASLVYRVNSRTVIEIVWNVNRILGL